MTASRIDRHAARNDLAYAAVTIAGLSRLLEGPLLWPVAVLLLGAVLLGSLQVLAEDDPAGGTLGVPIESLIVPSVAAVACLGAIRLVPIGLSIVPALFLTWFLVRRTLALEGRILAAESALRDADRTDVLVTTLLVAFLAFSGVAALVAGGAGSTDATPTPSLPEPDLLLLVVADGVVAFLLGYRASALRPMTLTDTLWSALTYAVCIAVAAAALRAMAIPRLLGPAILTLVFYLWDAFHAADGTRRREGRWLWQTAVLAGLGVVVVAWNLLLRR
ncbi:MAG: hypothetical protein ACJ761_11455 [Chloroflexota bacterium]